MMESTFSKQVRAARKERKVMLAAGYEELNDSGGMLWELDRGGRIGHKITDAIVSVTGKFVWVKVEKDHD